MAMALPTKQVICINWGSKYGPLFINRLFAMVQRNITPPFSFTCFTDSIEGIRPEVFTEPLPTIDFELPKTRTGIWPKCRLWNAKLGNLEGPVLFLDLDLVITGSIDAFFTYGSRDDVILARNPSNPFEKMGQTSVYRFPVGKLVPLLTHFATDPLEIAEKYRYEQRFVTRYAPGGIKFWPQQSVLHFRHHCRRVFPLNYVACAKLPESAKIVIFPGDLKPQDAIDGRYHEGDAVRSPREHLALTRRAGRGRGILAHLRHYILPTEWVQQHWRE